VISSTTVGPGPTQEVDENAGAPVRQRGVPEPLTRQALRQCAIERQSIERRAIEAINWAMPAVNYDLMRHAMHRDAGGRMNQVLYWSRPFDWKNQMLTPNPDVIYALPFFDLCEGGPMVIEIPPAGDDGSITGTIMDCWQAPLEDVGPAGKDAGKGGKYVVLPPGHSDAVPEGFIALPCRNNEGYALLRSIPKSGDAEDIARAVAYAKRIGFYPLSAAAAPPPTTFVDAIDVVFDSTIPYDVRFFQSLDRIVQHEPWLDRDKAMIDVLRTLGIEKGRPDWRGTLTGNYSLSRFHALARLSYYGGFTSAQPSFTDAETYGGKTLVDTEIGYRFNQINLSIGARNLFDVYPDQAQKEFNNNDRTFPWAAASPFGYDGRYLYTRAEIVLGW